MKSLRQAVQEYLSMRRNLGFKLHEAGKGLLDFGHVHVADTHWYLSGSPELMREAMRRLDHRWEGRP